jgi:hypothetical protein
MGYRPISDWRGRKKKFLDGYVLVWVPEHPKCFNGGWYYEHRLVMENFYKRVLADWETVHHINENKQHNDKKNLFVCTPGQHRKAHK